MRESRQNESPYELSTLQVFLGGFGLALLAGYVNACMLALFHVPVSHTTGAFTQLGLDLVKGSTEHLWLLSSAISGFFTGAILSGMLISRHFSVSNRYGIGLIFVAALILLAAQLSSRGSLLAIPIASLACGFQNAMATIYRGLVVRTTHTTGLVTDLGIYVGRRLRGDRQLGSPILVQVAVCLGFFLGVVVGALAAHGAEPRPDAIGWAAWPTLMVGIGYWLKRHRDLRARSRSRVENRL